MLACRQRGFGSRIAPAPPPCFSDAVVKRVYASPRKCVNRFSPNASESRFPGVLAVLLERSLVPRGMARLRPYFSRQLLARRGPTLIKFARRRKRNRRPTARRRVTLGDMQVRSAETEAGAVADAVGPLNALEADRYIEELRTFAFDEMGCASWVTQHEWLQQLNVQAHVNASQQRDEFVVEGLLLHEKLPVLVRELIASELWKLNVFPLLKDWLGKNNSIKGYLLLYHEAVIANLLETVSVIARRARCHLLSDVSARPPLRSPPPPFIWTHLEQVLFHEGSAEACGDLIVELADYCH